MPNFDYRTLWPPEFQRNRMYDDLAELWPLISDPANYAAEAAYWRDTLRRKLGPGRHRLLEMGVGGGNNLSHFAAEFDVVATDLSAGMLEHSKRLNPGVEHVVGDMRTLRLGRVFDAVIVHDAISYMLTEDDLRAALATAHAHLRPGGVFITSPDWLRETFRELPATFEITRDARRELDFFEYAYDPEPSDTQITTLFVYIIREGDGWRVESDLHETGLFSKAVWERLMREAGFKLELVEYPVHDDPRQAWLFVGTKTG